MCYGFCRTCDATVETRIERDATGSRECCVKHGHLTAQVFNEKPEVMPMVELKRKNPYRLGKPLHCGSSAF